MLVKLGDAFTIGSGGTPSKQHPEYYGGSIPWVKTGDLGEQYIYSVDECITEEGLKNSSARLYAPDTVLVAMYGATIGATSILKISACTNQACAAFLTNNEVIPEYLYYFLLSKKQRFVQDGVGGAQPNISATYLKGVLFPLRTYDEQSAIVDKLSRVTEVIKQRKHQLHVLNQFIKARFVEMFGDPVTNSLNWEKRRFDSLCENLDGRRRPITSTDRVAGPYPYYGASGIVDHVADYIFDEDILLISEDGANLLARSTPIAFSVRGKVWVNNHAHVLRFPDFALQKYIEYYFAMISIEDYITGSTQPKLNQAKLNAMLIPIPSKERMDAYHSFTEQVDKSKLSTQASLDQLETLKQSLMQKYFG